MGTDKGFNEAHLMEALAANTEMSRVESLQFIGLFTAAVTDALARGETVTLSNFGTLKAAVDAGRGRGKRYVSFRAGRRLKRALNPEK
jgi:nucleoid DNA-binding protein